LTSVIATCAVAGASRSNSLASFVLTNSPSASLSTGTLTVVPWPGMFITPIWLASIASSRRAITWL
jgi:hypothetical protein